MFAFGDAAFHGSVPGLGVAATVVSMARTASGNGYWALAADGRVFPFGDAVPYGSLAAAGLCSPPPAAAIRTTFTGKGYWVQGADGSTWAFGDAVDAGAVDRLNIGRIPTIGLAPAPAS
jgi:hypothetical protein